MLRSLVFTTQGRLHSRDLAPVLLPDLLKETNYFVWLDLERATLEETRLVLENVFHFHPLSIEDCVRASPSPKAEEYLPGEGDQFAPYLFMAIHAVEYHPGQGGLATRELNFFLGKNFLVTYHDEPLRSITQAEESAVKGTLRTGRAPDRLAHGLLDSIVESYYPVLDELAQGIARLEERALEKPDRATLNQILQTKKEVVRLRQIIGPQREVLARFARGEFKVVRPHMVPYYRDVYDALFHLGELAQGYADSLTAILQVYLNMSSNQTGEIVKLLTLITVITTPLMMVGTWYGMNFHDMPELSWKYGYAVAGGTMVVSTLATFWYFKTKKWF